MKGLEKPDDVAVVRIIAAAVVLHGDVSSRGMGSAQDVNEASIEGRIDRAFLFADAFIVRAMKEGPP